MNNKDYLGSNIRSLRKAFGETQEQLGEILNIEKNTVSSYETGTREPNKDMLKQIADHFLVSTEELLHTDLSSIGKIHLSKNSFWEYIDIFLPVICRDESLKNGNFTKACKAHRELYKNLKQMNFDAIDIIDICFDEYYEAYEDETCREDTAGNLIALWYLLMLMLKMAPAVVETEPAPLKQLMREDEKTRKTLENIDGSFAAEARELLEDIFDDDTREKIREHIKVLKKSSEWSYLGDYYLAMSFFWNFADNDLDWGLNRRVGLEMLFALVSVDNIFAARFLKCNEEITKGKSSRTVDDK